MIDEQKIDVIVRSLKVRIVGYDERKGKADSILRDLRAIQLQNGQVPQDVGQPMSQERRQYVYDRCIPAAEDILHQNPEADPEPDA